MAGDLRDLIRAKAAESVRITTTSKGLSGFVGKINTFYKKEVITSGALSVERFSSGSIELDIVLGGGWPRRRIALLYGKESSGKTFTALQACKTLNDLGESCLIVDPEGTYDPKWAEEVIGLQRDKNLYVQPEYGEQVVDIVTSGIREGIFGLIVVDSLAATVPSVELEKSSEEQQMGVQARLLNKAFRKWQSAMIAMQGKAPTLILINQEREKIGVMYGDPTTLPGGKSQHFYSSIKVKFKAGKVHDEPGKTEGAYVELAGVVTKNKTFRPHLEFSLLMFLKEMDGHKLGEIDNFDTLIKYCRELGLLSVVKGICTLKVDGEEKVFPSKDAVISELRRQPELRKKVTNFVITKRVALL